MKNVSFFFISTLFVFNSYAVVHDVGVNSNNFSPSSITTVQVGDVIRWTLNGGSHTTTSVSVPAGAATWDHTFSTVGETFEYTVAVAGSYTYQCDFHGGMTGSFSTATLDINSQNAVSISIFPVPFNDFIVVNHPFRTKLELVDVYGKVLMVQDNPTKQVSGFDTYDLDKGIYFLILKTDKTAVEIRKILKTD